MPSFPSSTVPSRPSPLTRLAHCRKWRRRLKCAENSLQGLEGEREGKVRHLDSSVVVAGEILRRQISLGIADRQDRQGQTPASVS